MATYSVEFYPKSLARKVRVDVVIPSLDLRGCLGNKDDEYYQNKKEKYPLIIFLCGFGDNEKSWQNNTKIISLCEKKGIAACFVNGENNWYLNRGPILDYYSFLERDLTDFLYGNFSFLSKEMPLIIAGVSMGGYGALYHYLKNTSKYQGCIALSPATKPDYIDETPYGTLRDLFLSQKGKHLNIYLSIGEKDFIIDASRKLDEFLSENQIDCRYKYVPGADHSWSTWDKEVLIAIDHLDKTVFH
jgi:putative tributyrin esterase